LRVLPNAYPPIMISRNQLMLEDRIRKILAALAEEVRTGELPLTATHLKTHQRFKPDPTLIEEAMGSHGSRDQIPTNDRMIKYLRFQETPSTIRRNFRLRGAFLAATAFGTAGFAPKPTSKRSDRRDRELLADSYGRS
jgi:hypothetical protein